MPHSPKGKNIIIYSSLYRHIFKERNRNKNDHKWNTWQWQRLFCTYQRVLSSCDLQSSDSRNQEGECHVSREISDEWAWTGVRKWEVLTAYKAHSVHYDWLHSVIVWIRWAGMQDWPKSFLVMLEKMLIMMNINHTSLETFFSVLRLLELQTFEQLVVLAWFF